MNDSIKIFGLEIRLGRTQVDLKKVDELLQKTTQSIRQAKKDWLAYSQTLNSLKGHELILQFMKEFEVKAKSTTVARRAMTAEEKVATRETRDAAKAAEMQVLAEKSRIGSIRQLEAEISQMNILWRTLSREERASTAEGRAMTAQLAAMRKELRETKMAAGDFSGNIGNYISGINGITPKFALISGAVMGVKRLLSGVFDPFKEFEYQMSMVRTVTRATDEEFIALEADARRLGAATQFTATQVAELQVVYGQLGFNAEQIVTITEATLDLATATGEDLAKSADIAGATLRAYNLDVSEMPRVIDVMTLAMNKSALKLDTYGEAMKYIGPIAAQTGVSIEECSALIGVLADQGIRGSMAGTSLRRILSELAKDGRPLNERLAELSKTGITVTDAMDEVGKHAMTAMTIIGNNTGKVDELTAAFESAAGAAKEAAAITRDNMRTDGSVFLSAVQEKLIAIGEYLSPLARKVIQLGTTLISNIKEVTLSIVSGYAAVQIYNTYLNRKIILARLSAINDKASALATALSTASLSGNTAALVRNSMAIKNASLLTKAYAIVKLLLAGNTKAAAVAMRAFTAAMAKNPFGLIAIGLASVISYFLFFRKETNEATKAQQRFNDENERFNKAQDEKRQRIEQLIRTIQDETETEYAKVAAYEELQRLSPALTDKYTQEQIATLKLAETTRFLNEMRDNEKYTHLTSEVEKYTNALKDAQAELDDINERAYSKTGPTVGDVVRRLKLNEQIKDDQISLAQAQRALTEFVHLRNEAADKLKPIKVRIIEAEADLQQFEDSYNQSKAKYQEMRDRWAQEFGNESTIPLNFSSAFEFDLQAQEKQIKDQNKKIEGLKKTTTTDSDKEKGEWSLSKDKAHNDTLLKLKEQLYKGEITSEEAYNKQVLQLEIDTLAKRIALNKDGSKTLIKLQNDLADKQFQLQKTQEKEEETIAANQRAREEQKLKDENDHTEAEINLHKKGVDKKLAISKLSTDRAQESADKEYASQVRDIDKKLKLYDKDSAEYKAIEAEKIRLAGAYDQRKIDIAAAGANEIKQIIKDASVDEIAEYEKVEDKVAVFEEAITEKKRDEVEKRLALARRETDESISKANNQYDANEGLADATLGTKGRKRNVAHLQNEIQLHKDQAQSYQKELNDILAGGDEAIVGHKARYDELIQLIGKEQEAATNLGKGKEANGERKSIWKQLTEMSDEEVNQLKQEAFDLAAQIGNAMIDAQKQASQRRLNNEKKAIEAQYKVESKLLDSKRNKGLISEKKYQKEMEKLEEAKAKKEEEAERAAFEREKRYNIAQTWMNVAMGIVKIWADAGANWFKLPFAIAQTAFLGAQGIAQTAFIASQKFAQGGIIPLGDGMGVVKGRSHAQGGHQLYIDGRPIGEIESDELIAIVNKHDTRRIGALSAANSVHGRKFASGGLMFPNGFLVNHVAPPVSIAQVEARTQAEQVRRQEAILSRQDAAIEVLAGNIQAINNRIDTLKVVVVESDISEAQTSVKKVKVKSSW